MRVKDLKAIAHETTNEDYLRLIMTKGDSSCGFVDFIAEKVNFNISGEKVIFKGMENISNMKYTYKNDKLVLLFNNKQTIGFDCNPELFEKISNHFERYGHSEKSQHIKSLFSEELTGNEKMRIVKIDRGHVEVEIDGHILRMTGEAMLPKTPPELSKYVLYKNTLNWTNTDAHTDIDEEALFSFLRKEFLKRNLILMIE